VVVNQEGTDLFIHSNLQEMVMLDQEPADQEHKQALMVEEQEWKDYPEHV
jgi:hypothetical protein